MSRIGRGLIACSLVGVTAAALRSAAHAHARRRGAEQRLGEVVGQAAQKAACASSVEPFGGPTIAIVLAAFNEADTIGTVLRELPGSVMGLSVVPIVVVDGGDDATEDIVRKLGRRVLRHPTNVGQGAALRTGICVALDCGAQLVATMDADGQHDPTELEALVEPILADRADWVQGSRFLGRYDDAGGVRHAGVLILTRVVNLLSGAGITDCANGYRVIRGSALERLRLEEPQFSGAEMIVEAARRGLRMQEVPVHIRARSHGESKKPRRLAYPLGYLGTAWRTSRRS